MRFLRRTITVTVMVPDGVLPDAVLPKGGRSLPGRVKRSGASGAGLAGD